MKAHIVEEIRRTARLFSGRSLEWYSASTLIATGVALLWPGETFTRPWYAHMQYVAPEEAWGLALMAAGVAQMLAIVCCREPPQYWCRTIACGVSCALWVYIALPLVLRSPPAAGAMPYFTLGIAMALVVGRGRAV